jgi:hypothetical protein
VRLGIAQSFNAMIFDVRCFRDTLEEFATRSCLDSDIQRLDKYSKGLRCVGTCCSACVSDRAVDYILMFEQLEELIFSKPVP